MHERVTKTETERREKKKIKRRNENKRMARKSTVSFEKRNFRCIYTRERRTKREKEEERYMKAPLTLSEYRWIIATALSMQTKVTGYQDTHLWCIYT